MQAISLTISGSAYDAAMKTGRPSLRPRTVFGERLLAARETLGLSQAQVADKLKITQASYGAWERDPVALRPDQIETLTNVLKISVETLFAKDADKRRISGPAGKARLLFEEVSKLPRNRQQRILATVEDMLTAQRVATA